MHDYASATAPISNLSGELSQLNERTLNLLISANRILGRLNGRNPDKNSAPEAVPTGVISMIIMHNTRLSKLAQVLDEIETTIGEL